MPVREGDVEKSKYENALGKQEKTAGTECERAFDLRLHILLNGTGVFPC